MKLDEIKMVIPQTSKGYDPADFKTGEKVTSYEGYDIFKSTSIKNPNLERYALQDQDKNIKAELVGARFEMHGNPYLANQRAWVENPNRRQGYATALYVGIVNRLELNLISDSEFSPESKALWETLRDHLDVVVFDDSTGEFLSYDAIDDSKLYDAHHDTYRLVARKRQSRFIPEKDLDAVHENIIFTSTLNVGLYE